MMRSETVSSLKRKMATNA